MGNTVASHPHPLKEVSGNHTLHNCEVCMHGWGDETLMDHHDWNDQWARQEEKKEKAKADTTPSMVERQTSEKSVISRQNSQQEENTSTWWVE
uniref:Uncharacterized protein n=1 Tax=Chromera velia CCMP2878 TaxID=1169474 RepID=A0A0G4H8P7_9ALVE|mmetsp:Transcript_37144/g.73089  ORF Transcript_37144/g.73089 Transcript_37144/m.73089 type:complete len:93 (-) Transcript_37144:1192-1470(-)|eukprot:Cvel_25097.t1-p1 / transcript=Cvel_25097.t1 / gene=Cvel_25097 / organism=Chromera_velia_CCMP2878 / gene_product=hypothetical protein / transcript_product=hypothetical protein / location=Cvel_scaffold2798:13358-13633(+) / protein_length=92 / sequence_SO=supercontig / SO=protein_coding / is_pseudo=false